MGSRVKVGPPPRSLIRQALRFICAPGELINSLLSAFPYFFPQARSVDPPIPTSQSAGIRIKGGWALRLHPLQPTPSGSGSKFGYLYLTRTIGSKAKNQEGFTTTTNQNPPSCITCFRRNLLCHYRHQPYNTRTVRPHHHLPHFLSLSLPPFPGKTRGTISARELRLVYSLLYSRTQ